MPITRITLSQPMSYGFAQCITVAITKEKRMTQKIMTITADRVSTGWYITIRHGVGKKGRMLAQSFTYNEAVKVLSVVCFLSPVSDFIGPCPIEEFMRKEPV